LIASRAQVDPQNPVEVRACERLGGSRELDAGVVDEDVDAAEILGGVGHHAHDILLAGDVALDEDFAHALLTNPAQAGVHLLLGFGRLVGGGQVVDGDVRAVLGEADRDRLSDSR
jgi:hypothetical protein